MGFWLYEYERQVPYAPASEEDVLAWELAISAGKNHISKGSHGIKKRFTVKDRNYTSELYEDIPY